MIQTVTIRQQILQALQRVYDSMGFDDPLDLDRMEKELLAEFAPTAFALTPSDGFHEIALANGYVKLAHDEIIAKRGTSGEVCFGTVDIGAMVRKFGYIKLEPGECVVKVEDLKVVLDDYRAADLFDGDVADRLTATIDAASKE